MKVYLIEDKVVAMQLKQLMHLNAECAKLQWSTTIKDLSRNVVNALQTIESYLEEKVYAVCNDENAVGTLSESEEFAVMALIKDCPKVKATLGTGIVMAGEESKAVESILKEKELSGVLLTAITSRKHVVLF